MGTIEAANKQTSQVYRMKSDLMLISVIHIHEYVTKCQVKFNRAELLKAAPHEPTRPPVTTARRDGSRNTRARRPVSRSPVS